ncbi:Glycosyltransferase involved in cell wall bisynthesis [Actinomadura meyerae]|uniref:Glycosyltransferase involved in cell wall bisynthesis n=1 Tax=Actinomadura meyerae TaxID=240840 RepID=A0A239NPT9_9ACTN|nr:glycosyltransferase [Actinomadura meyerae]SNT56931.1 Glycosyltransferase involved in cell wall bisynthesis [Actinomadura meyerae]
MRPRALVYGDVDLNIIDGSAIWAQAIVQALACAGCAATLVLKAPVRTGRLVDPLRDLPGVTVRSPHAEGLADAPMAPRQAAEVLARLDAEAPHDLVVVRGRRLAARLASGPLAGRLWTYLTDVPQSAAGFDAAAKADLRRIADASRVLLCQTEELRGFLEAAVPATAGKSVLFPPVVVLPDGLEARAPGAPEGPLRLVYTGKFAPRWNTHEMTSLPRLLAVRGVHAELHMVGDKIHDDPADPGFAARMRTALETGEGVVWHGGHPRAEAMRLTAGCDVGLSWRDPSMDASLELSTKVLECGMLGVPVVLNRTPMHERLLGADYPLFAATEDDVLDALTLIGKNPDVHTLAADRCRAAAAGFTLDAAAERLRGHLAQAFPEPSASVLAVKERPLRVGVAGHDLKFFDRLLDYLRSRSDMEVRVDHWAALKAHDEKRSQDLVDWADVIVCEWCGPNALWYASRKRPGQRLVVRLHRFELYAAWPRQLDIDAVDRVVCVSPHYGDLTREVTGWPAAKVVTIPNWVDDAQLDRAKLPGAEHHLGMIGIAPSRKRLDRALDVLEELRGDDPRFTLFVKSKLPWDYWWIWQKPEERDHYEKVFRRIRRSRLLSGGVVFDSYGRDVASWLRRIGFVLSTSDDESFHLAPAEGMASGAVPALLNWPGAGTIYDARWIHESPRAMAASIAETVSLGRWRQDGDLAREQVRAAYALPEVCRQWTDLLAGRP